MAKDDLNTWFSSIKEAYENYYKMLLKKGKLPLRSTDVGFWGASVSEEVWDLFIGYLNLYGNKKFIDLGSGDGKVALLASLFTNSTGIEHDEELHGVAEHMKKHFKLSTNFVRGNFLEHDLSPYDLLFINPDQPMHALEKKLLREMNGKLVVYGLHYQPTTLKKVRSFSVGGTPVSIYTRP